MKIVIVGGGKVGESLCQELSSEHNDILVIEKKAQTLDKLINKFDISGIVGNGASVETQEEIGVSQADVFIAVTEMDEINIIAAVLARKLGATHTIARVRNPEYSSQLHFVRESLGISLLVNPELTAAQDIARVLKYQSAVSVEAFAGNRVNLVEVEVTKQSILTQMSMKDFRQKFGTLLVCVIHRGDTIIIPSGEDVIQENDRIHVTGSAEDLGRFFKHVGKEDKKIKSTFIVGGGRLAYYLLKMLRESRIQTRVIERDEDRALFLSEEFPNMEIIHADGTDQDILDEQQVESFDSFISLTGVDEENLIMSMYARHKGVKKVITKMSRVSMLKLLDNVPIRSIITPKQLVTNQIIQFVRALENAQGSNVEALYRLVDNQVEALQFRVKRGSKVCGIPLFQLKTKANLLIAYIIRDKQLIFPNGNDALEAHDRVIVVTKNKSFTDLDDILEVE
ncbi:MAG: Trk system potassium transporter TrkA [Aerococcaceae bacterium]|nr:Trk system potassium transporter TrkA [Aerococcaceae bacterium]